jgi:hypothetical protein
MEFKAMISPLRQGFPDLRFVIQDMVRNEAMKWFILGATGGIGRHLVRLALERSHFVTAFVRSTKKIGEARRYRLPVFERVGRSPEL